MARPSTGSVASKGARAKKPAPTKPVAADKAPEDAIAASESSPEVAGPGEEEPIEAPALAATPEEPPPPPIKLPPLPPLPPLPVNAADDSFLDSVLRDAVADEDVAGRVSWDGKDPDEE